MSLDASSAEPDAIDPLIQRCLAGDQTAWEQIVRTNRRRVFNIAYKFTGRHDLAEDLTQDVFVKIFKSLNTFDRRANFQTWLVSVSRNLCIDHYRSVRKEREAIDRDVDPGDLAPVANTTSPYQSLEQRDRASLLRRGLAELAPTLRDAVLMRDLQAEVVLRDIASWIAQPTAPLPSGFDREVLERMKQDGDRTHATSGPPDIPNAPRAEESVNGEQ